MGASRAHFGQGNPSRATDAVFSFAPPWKKNVTDVRVRAGPLAPLQLGNEKRLLDLRIEFVEQPIGTFIAAQRGGAETAACQFHESLFGESNCRSVRAIELVARLPQTVPSELKAPGGCTRPAVFL